MYPEDAQPLIPYAEVRYVGIGEITIYLVADNELLLLERGGPSSKAFVLAAPIGITGGTIRNLLS